MERSILVMLRRVNVPLVVAALVVAGCSSTGSPSPSSETGSSSSPGTEIATPETQAASPTGTGRLPGEPDPTLTPGATNPVVTQDDIGSTICVSGWTATVRPPSSYTTSLKRQQIVTYGYRDTNLADYEEDHLIPLELGGAPADPKNLWPEPYSVSLADGTPDGARVKDQLENELRSSVCAGQLALATAQQEIATDWVRAWLGLGGSGPPTSPTASASPSPAPSATPGSSAAGELSVTITSLTSPVSPGSSATLRASTAAGASCSISVVYKSGPSQAAGLTPATADGAGAVAWTWTVGSRTTPGSWPVTVSCSAGGSTASAGATLVVQ